MDQIIGSVRINEDDYPGRDLYSDGAVEDELLEIARNENPSRFDIVCAERKSWPVMYHFSSVRQNIVSWYPFRKTDRVLEIGSGCGAVTPALVRAAGSVTCVDLSKKSSLVNAYRNRNAGNIEIRLGNFADVEKKLPAGPQVFRGMPGGSFRPLLRRNRELSGDEVCPYLLEARSGPSLPGDRSGGLDILLSLSGLQASDGGLF